MPNPFLPLREYVPDGEPHVFGNRVYLYGSHDREGGTRFCEQDYVVYSANVFDLENWTYHGISYKKSQDPRSRDDRLVDFYAPDCVQGNDGRYYLYYVAMGPNVKNFGPMSVAVSNRPEGPFEYLGDIRWPDGTPMTMFLTNDPAVLNDNGRIWLYYGWGLGRDFRSKLYAPIYNLVQSKIFQRPVSEIRDTLPSILSCAVVELEQDMLTVKSAPKSVLDCKTTANRNSELYQHAFYEAASIRKFGEIYYLVYSSGFNNELAYATSKYPDRDFVFRGTIISNADLGLNGNAVPKAPAGTIHGGIENINGQYYIFYHRCTHNTDFSRQACAEPIVIEPDGTIRQVEITSCGLSGKPLDGKGTYPAAFCCNLYTRRKIPLGLKHRGKFPQIIEENGEQHVSGIVDGTVVGYKYFNLLANTRLAVKIRGTASGTLEVRGEENGCIVGAIPVKPNSGWSDGITRLKNKAGKSALFLTFHGTGKMDLMRIGWEEK